MFFGCVRACVRVCECVRVCARAHVRSVSADIKFPQFWFFPENVFFLLGFQVCFLWLQNSGLTLFLPLKGVISLSPGSLGFRVPVHMKCVLSLAPFRSSCVSCVQ